MELKYVIPNMEKTFGNLEYAGEGNIEQRRINGHNTILSRSYNLYSDIQTLLVSPPMIFYSTNIGDWKQVYNDG